MSKSYKGEIHEMVVEDAIATGIDDLKELHEECDGAYQNMIDGGMSDSHPKVEAFEEAANLLEEAEEPDLENIPADALSTALKISLMINRRKNRSPARWVRCGNACAMLQAAADELRAHECTIENAEDKEAAESDIAELCDTLETIAGNCENIEFPGLYG